MKGYRMILLVNGFLLLFVALSAYLLGTNLENQYERCTADAGACEQTRDAATTSFRVAPFLVAGGILLLVLGATLGRKTPSGEPLPATSRSDQAAMPHDWTKALHDTPSGLVIDVEVIPNSSSPGFPVGFNPWRNRIQGRVAAPAEEGKANEELTILVAAALNVSRDKVTILEGHTSRRKRLQVVGLTAAEFTRRVAEALGGH